MFCHLTSSGHYIQLKILAISIALHLIVLPKNVFQCIQTIRIATVRPLDHACIYNLYMEELNASITKPKPRNHFAFIHR